MARGGYRENAGRKTQWESGCSFPETVVIRVPEVLKQQLLEIAHRLDAGEEVDFVSKSKIQRINYLENRLLELQVELQRLQDQPKQLELLPSKLETVTKSKAFLDDIRDKILKTLPVSQSSRIYKDEKKKYDLFIKAILETK